MDIEQLLTLLRDECTKAGTQAAWAKSFGLSAPYVSDVLNGRRDPGKGILDALSVREIITYEKRHT